MKKILAFLILSAACFAQTVVTGAGGSTKTALSGGAYTVATLPAGQQKGTIAVVSDGASATDCTVGGGSTTVTCQYNGSAWAVFTGGGKTDTISIKIGGTAAHSPSSATTYYFGDVSAAQTTSTAFLPAVAPVACTLKAVSYALYVSGTKDTGANNITFKVYDITTASAFADTAGTLTAFSTTQHGTTVSSANDSIAAGDQLAIQLVTPTFTVAPVNVNYNATLICQP